MMYRFPMHPETLKLLVAEQERLALERAKRRKARLLAREIKRAVEQYRAPGDDRPHPWRYPFGLRAHAAALALVAVVTLIMWCVIG